MTKLRAMDAGSKRKMKLGGRGGMVQLGEDQLAGIEDVHQIMNRAEGHG